jgi:hypothetical protein
MTFRGQTEIDTLSPQAAGAYVNAKRKNRSHLFLANFGIFLITIPFLAKFLRPLNFIH